MLVSTVPCLHSVSDIESTPWKETKRNVSTGNWKRANCPFLAGLSAFKSGNRQPPLSQTTGSLSVSLRAAATYNTGQQRSLCFHLVHNEEIKADRNGARLSARLEHQPWCSLEILCLVVDRIASIFLQEMLILFCCHCVVRSAPSS